MLPSSTLLVLQPGRLFETALPVLVVAVVTLVTLVMRSTLDDRRIRRFKWADLAAEVRAGLRVLEVFMDSCAGGAPATLRDLGPGLAITVAPIQCHEEYGTLSIAIKDALPTLSDGEFQAAATLKGCFRLIKWLHGSLQQILPLPAERRAQFGGHGGIAGGAPPDLPALRRGGDAGDRGQCQPGPPDRQGAARGHRSPSA